MRRTLWNHEAPEVHRRIVDIIARFFQRWNVRKEVVAFQISHAEDLHVARFARTKGIRQVVDTADNVTRDHSFHRRRAATFRRDVDELGIGCFLKLKCRDVVPHKKARARERHFAGVLFCEIDHFFDGVIRAVFANDDNSRVSAPVGNRLKAISRILNAAFDRLRDEVRDVVGRHCIAVCLSIGRKPVPANAATGTGFVENIDWLPEHILVARNHRYDPSLKVRCAACTIRNRNANRTRWVFVSRCRNGKSHRRGGQ